MELETGDADLSSDQAGEPFTDGTLTCTTTIASPEGSLLVVNSQFGARG